MARHRSKPEKPKGKPKAFGGRGRWQHPREQYVYGREELSLMDLWRMWNKHPGCKNYEAFTRRAKRQKWKQYRDEFQSRTMDEVERKFMEKDSDRRSKMLEKASERHIDLAQMYQQSSKELNVIGRMRAMGGAVCTNCKKKVEVLCAECGEEVKIPASKIVATDAYRTGARLMKDSIDSERKALGIADRIELDYRTTEMAREMIQVLEVVIPDADLMEEIVYRLRQVGRKDREELAKIAGGEVIDVTPKK